jgi:hypothetical protein
MQNNNSSAEAAGRLPVSPANRAAPLRPDLVAYFAFGLRQPPTREFPSATGVLAELAADPGAGWN